MDGFEVLQEIRALSKLPVLMLTAKDAAEDRFSGFELGADDYLIKPFLPKELLLRVQAILKRSYPTEKRIIELENSFIDIDKAEIHRENKIIPLTAKEYNILLKLVDNANHIVTIGTLCQMCIRDRDCLCHSSYQFFLTDTMGTALLFIKGSRTYIIVVNFIWAFQYHAFFTVPTFYQA